MNRYLICALVLAATATGAQGSSPLLSPLQRQNVQASSTYFDPNYPVGDPKPAQHLGVDLVAPQGTVVVSPVTGKVISNNTGGNDPWNFYLVIRSEETGYEHVLGHIVSQLQPGSQVKQGAPVGTVATAGTGPHVHWGINDFSIGSAIDTGAGWGFGRSPIGSDGFDASRRGWLNPLDVYWVSQRPQFVEPRWHPSTLATIPKELQARLNELGYPAGEPDGYPGPQTRNALMRFQLLNCLEPTGQPDDQTTIALAQVQPRNLACPRASFPLNVGANTPLKSGIYVSNLAYCSGHDFGSDQGTGSLRIIRGLNISFGWEGSCTTRRTDIRKGITLFRGTCYNGPEDFESSWTFNVKSPSEFVEISGYWAGTAGTVFFKCSEESTLRKEWAPWFQ